MFKFDVRFLKLLFIIYYKKVNQLRCWLWYHTRHSLNTKITKMQQLTLQNTTGCYMYPCDVISNVAFKCNQINE